MTTIITALILFGIIVLAHELGHFLVAGWVGIPAEEFSIGMGPKITQLKGKKTIFSLRALPIGGYVKFYGDEGNSDDPRAFANAKVWKRISVIAAGPIMNFLLAILLLAAFFAFFGVYENSTHIFEIVEGSPAEYAGLQAGDKIVSVNGIQVDVEDQEKGIEHFRKVLKEEGDKTLKLTVLRDDKAHEIDITPDYSPEKNTYEIGIYFGRLERMRPLSAIGLAIVQAGRLIILMIQLLGSLIFQGRGINEVVGPIGIIGVIGKSVKSGVKDVLNLAVVITLNLGIMNLIPFPALDGGRLTLLLVEGIRGNPIDPEKEEYIHFTGFIILMLLMIVITFKDVARQWF